MHFEIPADNPEKAMEFYQKAFGWTFGQFGPNPYWLATTGADSKPGINGAIMKRIDPRQPVANSIGVDNIDEALKKIEMSGGTIVVPKTLYPNAGWSAYFKDPDGNIFGVWEQNPTAK